METVHNMMHFSPTCSYTGDNKLHVILLRFKSFEVLKELSSFIKICLQFKPHLVVQGRRTFKNGFGVSFFVLIFFFFFFYLGEI